MNRISLSKQQSQTIAQQVYPDIKRYCLEHFERYFPWYLDDIRKSKGKAPLKPIIINRSPCAFCDCNSQTEAKRESECNG